MGEQCSAKFTGVADGDKFSEVTEPVPSRLDPCPSPSPRSPLTADVILLENTEAVGVFGMEDVHGPCLSEHDFCGLKPEST